MCGRARTPTRYLVAAWLRMLVGFAMDPKAMYEDEGQQRNVMTQKKEVCVTQSKVYSLMPDTLRTYVNGQREERIKEKITR